jgi:Uncharacterised nucleotidyltransferase
VTRPARELSTWLLDLATGHELSPVHPSRYSALAGMLQRHGLAPLAHVRTRSGAADLSARLRPSFEEAVGRHLKTRSVIAQLITVFGENDIEWRVLKGPVLSETAHPVPCARPYLDLDVLVRSAQLRPAVAVLLQCGWRLLDVDHASLVELVPGEVHLLSPTGVQLDLHWSIFNMASTRHAFPSREDQLFERVRHVRLGAHDVPTLSRDAFLVHVCLHAALAGGDRLLYLLDIDQLVRSTQPPDWPHVIELALLLGAGPAAAVALGRTRRLLGSPIDDAVLRGLADPSWRSLAALVDRLAPAHRSGDGGSLSRIVARSSRPTSRRSWAELGRRTSTRLHDTRAAMPSLAEPVPDEAALTSYFDRVVREVQARGSGPSHE